MHRRNFLTMGMAGLLTRGGKRPATPAARPLDRFKLGSISDEWSQDFEAALTGMKAYGLRWVEIRTLWNIYNTETNADQLRQIKGLLARYGFKVSVLDTALYKCGLPGTTPVGGEKDAYPYASQMELLDRAIERARELGTDKLRVFSFWRVERPAEYFQRIAADLARAAQRAQKAGMRLVLENESECNVATGGELARMLQLVPASNFGANWDIGNGYWQGEKSFPDGYSTLDKKRIWHMHLKDVRCEPDFRKCSTVVVGEGEVDIVGQFRALLGAGYQGTMSLEPEVETPDLTHLEATKRSLQALLEKIKEAMKES